MKSSFDYLSSENCHVSFIGKTDQQSPSKLSYLLPLYLSVIGLIGSLCLLGILIPVWINEIDNLEKLTTEEFAAIRIRSEAAWKQLLQIESDDNSVAWARIRRKTNDEYNIYDYGSPLDITNEASYSGKDDNQYMATPLNPSNNNDIYGKCCCNMDTVNIDALTVSWRCPVGKKGPPGQTGPIGEPGINGEDGRAGLDYPVFGNQADQSQLYVGAPATTPNEYPYSLASAYGSPPSSSPRVCEPCPVGPQGPPGPPGRTGNLGPKGVSGIPGKNGFHGLPGKPGPRGNMGPRGRTGQSGMPGTKGLDGYRGAKGAPGAKGRRGDIGVIGVRGPHGENGMPGRPGYMGPPGDRGMKGQRGIDGMDGLPGREGLPGDDGMYCSCPERTTKYDFNTDKSAYLSSPTNYKSTQWNQQEVYSRPTTTRSPPLYTRSHVTTSNTQDYRKRIYVTENPGIPVATKRNFVTNNPPPRSTSSRPFSTDANEYDENAFLGKNTFNGAPNAWSTNRNNINTNNNNNNNKNQHDEEETYGLDVAWLEDQRRHHKQHRIA